MARFRNRFHMCSIAVFVFITLQSGEASAGAMLATRINPANGHVYHLIGGDALGTGISWTDSEAFAQSIGSHLVTINDSAENAWVASTFYNGYGSVQKFCNTATEEDTSQQ